jgi:sugar phosphate isomerase/epimerase
MNKSILFCLMVGALPYAVFSQSNQPLYSAPLGVQAYTFRKSFPLNVPATLDTIKLMGFTEIEGGGGSMPPSEFKKLCDERGISIPSIGVGYEFLNKYPDSVASMAKQMGASFVMCAWIPHQNGVLTFQDAKKAVDDFNRIGKYLKEQGIIFCYHAHGYEFQPYENETLLDYIINTTNPEYVSFEMDIFWIQFGGGDPVELMKKYPNRWKLMHLKDIRKGAKKDLTGLTGPENDVVLGTGEIDIPAILREANKIGIKHFFIEDESNFVNMQVPQSILYLKSLQEK